MKTTRIAALLAVCFALLCQVPFAQGAAATMSSDPFSVGGVSTRGTLLGARNFESPATAPAVNGVAFAGQTATGANAMAFAGGITVNVFNGSASNTVTTGTGLFAGGVFTNNNAANGGVTFSGLTVGQPYEVQFFIGDNRNFSGIQNRTVNLYDQATASGIPEIANLDYTSAAGGGADQIITAEFIANATTQSFFIAIDDDGNFSNGFGTVANFPGHLNALQLRAVPEPASVFIWSVLGAVLCAIGYFRFRRAR